MANDNLTSNTHISDIKGRIRVETTNPGNPLNGDMYFNKSTNYLMYYNGTAWVGALFNN